MPADMKHVVTTLPWSDAERTLLRQLYENGMGPARIAQQIGRTKPAVYRQIQTLRLPRQRPAPDMTPRAPKAPPPQPLRRGARTLPPLPSELRTIDG